jgi:hypothetical protein
MMVGLRRWLWAGGAAARLSVLRKRGDLFFGTPQAPLASFQVDRNNQGLRPDTIIVDRPGRIIGNHLSER